jgi:hypothetical protein
MREHAHAFVFRLGNQKPIKRIAVVTVQRQNCLGMIERYIEPSKSLRCYLVREINRRQGEFAYTMFMAISHMDTGLT